MYACVRNDHRFVQALLSHPALQLDLVDRVSSSPLLPLSLLVPQLPRSPPDVRASLCVDGQFSRGHRHTQR